MNVKRVLAMLERLRGRLLPILAALCVGILAPSAHARCQLDPNNFGSLIYGNLSAGTLSYGDTIGSPQQWNIDVRCDKTTQGVAAPEKLTLAAANQVIPGTRMWATSNPGVGMLVTINGNVISDQPTFTAIHPGDGTTQHYTASVKLVKVGTVRPMHLQDDILKLTTELSAGGDHQELGTERIGGTLFNGIACKIAEDSRHQTLPLGTWPMSAFNGVGATTSKRMLSLHLICDPVGTPDATPMSVRFDGETVAGNNNLLKVGMAGGQTPATGIGIQLTNPATGVAFPLNEWFPEGDVAQGQRDVSMEAGYYQYGQHVTPGDASGFVTFRIDMR